MKKTLIKVLSILLAIYYSLQAKSLY